MSPAARTTTGTTVCAEGFTCPSCMATVEQRLGR